MLSREAFDRYIRQVSSLADSAGEYVRRMVGAYLGQHPDASVAECREFARQTMSDAVSIYGDASATAAADYYDSVMSAAGNGAKPALLHADVDDEQIERVARYQVGKLVNKGDQLGFARECASYASDATRQAANRTMIKNAQRDGRRGVRYARVPTGAETCTFCRMLSSRGFVYRSEESANLFGHNHRGCNCAVVPSTDSEGLEGYDPDREFDIWQKYEEIDADTSLSRAENEAAKQAILEEAEQDGSSWREDAKARTVNEKLIASKSYRAKLFAAAGENIPETLHSDAVRMLRHRSGTAFEDLYVYDLETGERIGSVVDSALPKQAIPTDKLASAIEEHVKSGHRVAMLHNHPDSSMPSPSDLASLQATGASYGIIACHDGTIYRYSLVDTRYAGYNFDELKSDFERALKSFNTRLSRGKSEVEALSALANDWGVKIEHLL